MSPILPNVNSLIYRSLPKRGENNYLFNSKSHEKRQTDDNHTLDLDNVCYYSLSGKVGINICIFLL